ncbi:hypothetical protein Tco_1228470 [Tanacetum coccineum]
MNDTSLMEKVDSNTTPDSSDMSNNEIEADHYVGDHEDEHVVLANLIANLKLNTDENKRTQNQLKKANTTLTHELNECKYALEESNNIRDRCRSAFMTKILGLRSTKSIKIVNLKRKRSNTKANANEFERALRQKMFEDLQFIQSLKKEVYELEYEKAEFSNEYDILLQECLSKDIMCAILRSFDNIDEQTEMQWNNENALKEQNDSLIVELNRKMFEIIDLKARLQDKTISNVEMRKSWNKMKAKDKALNTKPSVQNSARLPNIANGSKPKPRNSYQQPRNLPPSMSSSVSNRAVNKAEPPRNSTSFLNSKNLACPTCKKCIYSANHDVCILKYISKVNSHASAQKTDAQSQTTTKRYISVEKKSDSKNHGRQIPIGQRFSPNKTFDVYVKTTPPRYGLTWKPTSIIFTYVGLRWIPTKKSVETFINTNDSTSPLGKETCTANIVICANSPSLSAGISMASEPISSKGSTNVNIVPSSTLVQTSIIDYFRKSLENHLTYLILFKCDPIFYLFFLSSSAREELSSSSRYEVM